MEKDELLRILSSTKEIEEEHSAVITTFFLKQFDWSGYDEGKVSVVRAIIETIRKQSIEHSKILEDILKTIGKSEKNDI